MIAYFLATFVGLSLGLLGGGGSTLTVPILVYGLDIDPKTSIALSLAIVGLTSLMGTYSHYRKKNVELKVAFSFAPIAMVGTFVGARLSQFLSGQLQLILFAIVMLLASASMLKGRKNPERSDDSNCVKLSLPIFISAFLVGVMTGIVGVGGGFLIIPALVVLGKVSMKKAVGTSLLIIALNSVSGFSSYLTMLDIPWSLLFKFTFFSTIGIFIGSHLVQFVKQTSLKRAFGIFLILMGSFILYKNKAVLLSHY